MDLSDETQWLLTYLKGRGVTPQEACIIMGLALTALIGSEKTAQDYIATLVHSVTQAAGDGDVIKVWRDYMGQPEPIKH